MTFEFETYYRNICINPLSYILLCLFTIIVIVVYIVYLLVNKKGISKDVIIFLLLFSYIMYRNIPSDVIELNTGGIYLLSETPDDAISKNGVIQYITTPSARAFHFKGTNVNGAADITINGETYLIEEVGDFKIGDTVTITYLPKSKVILSIYSAEEAQ